MSEKPLFPIICQQGMGYTDATGQMAIDPRDWLACDFVDGLARVRVGEQWGFIDRTGQVITTEYDDSGVFGALLVYLMEVGNGALYKSGVFGVLFWQVLLPLWEVWIRLTTTNR